MGVVMLLEEGLVDLGSTEMRLYLIFGFGVLTWGSDKHLASSNLHEATNKVESFKSMAEQGLLDGVEVFFFIDNSTAEAVSYNVEED